jgi:CubicO group peptidase (beta-lactamase class C family)
LLRPITLALASLVLLPRAPAQTETLERRIDALFAPAFPADEPGCTVIATRDGKVVYRKAFGMASVELGVAARPEHVYCLASVTKPFTAIATLMLVEAGKLQLNDPASKYHPDLGLDDRITVAHLLSHTSGMPDFGSIEGYGHDRIHAPIRPEELFKAAKGQKLLFEPGSEFRYSNLGYALLAGIVAKVSGQTWDAFVEQRIFAKSGAKHSTYGGRRRVVPGLVTGYEKPGDGPWRRSRPLSFTRGYGLGGLLSNVDDLAAVDAALRAGKLLKPETVATMHRAPKLASGKTSRYALGWIVQRIRGHELVFHSGGIYGWRAMIVRAPEERVFVAVLSNRDVKGPGIGNNALRAAVAVIESR